jgi:hypothetical protein
MEIYAMRYVITADRPFGEIEAQTIAVLEQQGFVVRRTFSLESATRSSSDGACTSPGYSVLMLYASGFLREPLGLVTLYEQGGQTVLHSLLTLPAGGDVEAEMVAALAQSGLDFCVKARDGEICIQPREDAMKDQSR